jgi:hypothetical protein
MSCRTLKTVGTLQLGADAGLEARHQRRFGQGDRHAAVVQRPRRAGGRLPGRQLQVGAVSSVRAAARRCARHVLAATLCSRVIAACSAARTHAAMLQTPTDVECVLQVEGGHPLTDPGPAERDGFDREWAQRQQR